MSDMQHPSLMKEQTSFRANDLERERIQIERLMLKLEKSRSQRNLSLREDRITLQHKQLSTSMSIKKDPKSNYSAATTVMTSESSSSSSSPTPPCTKATRCSKCSRKDRIIHRQLCEIESLRQQLYEAKFGPRIPLVIQSEEDDSIISEMNNTFRDGL